VCVRVSYNKEKKESRKLHVDEKFILKARYTSTKRNRMLQHSITDRQLALFILVNFIFSTAVYTEQ
jgi:hypothetical protein